MPFLQLLQQAIDRFTESTGRLLAWLLLAMMILSCTVVILRYGFDLGFIALQESVTYLHASVFLLGAAYALKHGAHVRVDILYRRFTPRTRAWVDGIGSIVMLLPLCAYILVSSWDYVMQSWRILEISPEPGGIPAVFILKTMMLLMAANLGLQGLAETLRSVLLLTEQECDG